MLQVKNISKKYSKKTILDDLSVSFSKDKITALVGRNGAGKTTLLKIILGMIRPESGGIIFQEQNISTWKIHKRIRLGLGYIPESIDTSTGLSTCFDRLR